MPPAMREGGRLVVVGGVAAGMSAASRARRLRPDVEIVAFEAGGDVSYGACLLPYFVSGVIASRDSLVRVEADSFRKERRIDVRLNTEVTALDPVKRTVAFRGPDGSNGSLSFDALVLATGAAAVKPHLPGIDIPGVTTLRTLADGENLRKRLESGGVRKATVVGAGYIGLEMAEALASRGITVTVIELLPTVLSTFDPDMSELVEGELRAMGVMVRKETGVKGFEPQDGAHDLGYVVAGGQRLEADLALVSVGVRPSVGLASAAGLELGRTGAIKVDARQVTSVPSVLAAGDCAEAMHVVTRRPVWIPLGTTANKQGKLAGENAVGGSAQFGGVAGTNIAKVFGLEVAQTGLTERAAAEEGLTAASVRIKSLTKAHGYPGGGEIHVKLVFEPEGGRLLGGQIIGREGAGKRIDTIATALHARMTVADLADIDMSYAPPFSPVWDPVAMAALQAVKKVRT
ncbi:MAG: FAD-dependent oxidoreductase [Candidatus Eisenbacteria bacterium]